MSKQQHQNQQRRHTPEQDSGVVRYIHNVFAEGMSIGLTFSRAEADQWLKESNATSKCIESRIDTVSIEDRRKYAEAEKERKAA